MKSNSVCFPTGCRIVESFTCSAEINRENFTLKAFQQGKSFKLDCCKCKSGYLIYSTEINPRDSCKLSVCSATHGDSYLLTSRRFTAFSTRKQERDEPKIGTALAWKLNSAASWNVINNIGFRSLSKRVEMAYSLRLRTSGGKKSLPT